MTSEQFRAALHARPFRPFVVKTADGLEYVVPHPERAILSAQGRTAMLALEDDGFAIVDLLLVSALVVPATPAR